VSDSAPFSTRLGRNLRAAVGLLAALWIAGVVGILIRGAPLLDAVLAALAIFVFIGPPGVLTYSALSPWRTRGFLAHYGVWVATVVGAWLPLFLLAQVVPIAGSDLPLFDHPLVFFVAAVMAGLVWGSITQSINNARERARRAIDDKRSA
jgi:hypothetical protein